jgi:triphosphoribosyl-dephospho-CoA synthase
MNYYTFIDSACALTRYFVLMAAAGFSSRSPKQIFAEIRVIGKEAELAMYRETKGINTHKGAIFLLGILSASLANAIQSGKTIRDIPNIIRSMTEGLVASELKLDQLSLLERPTHGETIFLRHNLPGVRAEVEAGLPIVFNQALPLYEAGSDLPQNDRLVQTLITIICHCDDTTIVHRHSPEVLSEVKVKALDIIAVGGVRTIIGRAMIDDLQDEFTARNISPVGSADLLGCVVFLGLANKKYFLSINQS